MQITDIKGFTTLSNGVRMPYLGFGVYQINDGLEVIDSINNAFNAGYRHIDTAALYENERGVGQSVRESGIPRNEIFVTSKVWNSDQGYDKTLKAFDESMKKFKFDTLDLYLIHWPTRGKFKDTWRALEKIYEEGRVKSIGVSNFLVHHLEDLFTKANICPMANQVEFHPYLVHQPLLDFCATHKIQFQSWSPFMHGQIFAKPDLKPIAAKYNKSVAQLIVRWNLQKNVVVIPKSVKKQRIIENTDVFDFSISDEDMALID